MAGETENGSSVAETAGRTRSQTVAEAAGQQRSSVADETERPPCTAEAVGRTSGRIGTERRLQTPRRQAVAREASGWSTPTRGSTAVERSAAPCRPKRFRQ